MSDKQRSHKHRHNHSASWHKRRKLLMVSAGALVAILVIVAVFSMMNCAFDGEGVGGSSSLPVAQTSQTELEYKGKTYVRKNNVETMLILGLDKFENPEEDETSEDYSNNKQADFLMLLVVDNNNEKCSAIHINRDTMTMVDVLGLANITVDTVEQQIALAHTYGDGGRVSCNNTANSASRVLKDEKIDHYMSLTMEAVPQLNDLVGGVEVEVLDDFAGIDDTLVKGETVTLMGEQALRYVRTRYGLDDSTNNTRMLRQQQYINAFIDKAQTCARSDDDFISELIKIINESFVSDCSITRLESFLNKITDYELTGIYALDGESIKGERFMEFRPTEDSVTEVLINTFYEQKKN